jgi:hypothetical protein
MVSAGDDLFWRDGGEGRGDLAAMGNMRVLGVAQGELAAAVRSKGEEHLEMVG